jgi:hypothetical protein
MNLLSLLRLTDYGQKSKGAEVKIDLRPKNENAKFSAQNYSAIVTIRGSGLKADALRTIAARLTTK